MKDKHVVKVTRDQVQSARALIDFAGGEVTTTVSNETFSTYVLTERTGPNTWRVRDNSTDEVSNEVRVQIG